MRARVAFRLKAILRAMNRLPPVCVRAHPVVRRAYPWCPVSLRRPMCSRSSCATCASRWCRHWPSRWIGAVFAAGLDYEEAVAAVGVFRLIPLQLVIAHKSVLVAPYLGVGLAVAVKLVAPHHAPCLVARCLASLASHYIGVCRRSGTLSAAIYGVSCRGPWGSIYRP